MSDVLAAEPAVLAQLEPLARLLLVLRGAVIAAFALGARQRDDVSHCVIPCRDPGSGVRDPRVPSPEPRVPALFNDLGNRAGADRAAAFTNREPRALFE